jgi:hypothetical protein
MQQSRHIHKGELDGCDISHVCPLLGNLERAPFPHAGFKFGKVVKDESRHGLELHA